MSKIRKFHMKFEPMTIEHLGLRLYSTLPPVLGELVSNAYDAESKKVEVVVPKGSIVPTSEVIVRDWGHGMDADELELEYLPIGRNRRGLDSKSIASKNGKRTVTGRKGLGKLSAFGIADEMEIRAVSSGEAWTLLLNYQDMMSWAESNSGQAYEPTVVEERTGPTTDPVGIEVTLRKLRRKSNINADDVRRGLARRLDVADSDFTVVVNGVEIGPGDRAERGKCGQSWDLSDTEVGDKLEDGHQVSGWIGFLSTSSQTGRGVNIYAHRKAAELGSFFDYAVTHAQFARAYLVGEVHADFLDGEEDLVATARNQVLWDSPSSQSLQDWGQRTLRWAFGEWVADRRKKKEKEITREAGFDRWLESRTAAERGVAGRMVKMLVDDEDLDPASARPLLEIIKASVETVAFRDLVERMETGSAQAKTLLQLFDEWRVIEAREHLQLADGRLSAIDKLEEFIEEGALEVKELQPLLVENLWLIDPHWTEVDVQPTYTKLLRKHCKEPSGLKEKDRRLDIVGVTEGRQMKVVELKRTEKTLSRDDLDQIEDYVDWARANILGTDDTAPQLIEGLLVVGKMSSNAAISGKMTRLAGDGIRVATYRDLHNASRRQYKELEHRLQSIAPEYTRTRRKAARKK